ncbi:ABC transporter ATP-binding protein [Massilimicrobiota sp. An80]|uniref:ABC transporter ATP-binding protein n=1 Tax=Massilimicrobiota sp. An80 TaxID=1965658 RepID=UPI000B437672|nr:ABC transporter ATP-binding protein [Massilimicrobiota sp. An80]OUN34033.1 ABC transporter [Massilimicrobiota sp. An80]
METTIKVQNLCKSYGNIPAIKDINISVNQGEVFGLLGANGAGKSTTIECILGTKIAEKGTVSILGMNPIADRKRLFENVGVQFQESNYQDKVTVSELCEVTQSLYKSAANYTDLIEQFGLTDKLKSLVSELSGGQRQKLFIVLALIPNPKVVFLDELTTGLDTKARREVWHCLSRLKEQGLTIFLTSHFMDEVEALCDRIAILKKGQIVFTGTVTDAIQNSPYKDFEDVYLWYAEEEIENENL